MQKKITLKTNTFLKRHTVNLSCVSIVAPEKINRLICNEKHSLKHAVKHLKIKDCLYHMKNIYMLEAVQHEQ